MYSIFMYIGRLIISADKHVMYRLLRTPTISLTHVKPFLFSIIILYLHNNKTSINHIADECRRSRCWSLKRLYSICIHIIYYARTRLLEELVNHETFFFYRLCGDKTSIIINERVHARW